MKNFGIYYASEENGFEVFKASEEISKDSMRDAIRECCTEITDKEIDDVLSASDYSAHVYDDYEYFFRAITSKAELDEFEQEMQELQEEYWE